MLHEAYISAKHAEVSTLCVRKLENRKVSSLQPRKSLPVTVIRTVIIWRVSHDKNANWSRVRGLVDLRDYGAAPAIAASSSLFGFHRRDRRCANGLESRQGDAETLLKSNRSQLLCCCLFRRRELEEISSANWPYIHGLTLADPQFLADNPMELLLGAEVCYSGGRPS